MRTFISGGAPIRSHGLPLSHAPFLHVLSPSVILASTGMERRVLLALCRGIQVGCPANPRSRNHLWIFFRTMTQMTPYVGKSSVSVNDPEVVTVLIPHHSEKCTTSVENPKKRRMAKVHSLPCTIHKMTTNGQQTAAVNVYFQPTEITPSNDANRDSRQQQDNECNNSLLSTSGRAWAAQFRGRGLIGRECHLPPHVSGIVISEAGYVAVEGDQGERKKRMSVEAFFNAVTEWGHDEDPSTRLPRSEFLVSNSTKVSRALDWLELAATVCCRRK